MSCPCCGNEAKWTVLKAVMNGLKLNLQYCPVCSNSIYVKEFLDNMKAGLAEVTIQFPDTETVKDENGNELILDRELGHGAPKKTYTPSDMSIDLDKVDITREMKILGIKEN